MTEDDRDRSLEARIRELLARAAPRSRAETRLLSAHWQKRLAGSSQSDSAVMIRRDRDRR